jgi:hypothetical protein
MLLSILLAAPALAAVNPHALASLPPAFVPTGVLEDDQASMVADELGELGTLYAAESVGGLLYTVHLRGSPLVRGVPCGPTVMVLPDGSWTCELRAAWSAAGLGFAEGAWLRFAVGSGQLLGWTDPDARTTILAGVPCGAGVELGEDGDLRACVLQVPHRFRGTELLPAGAHVELVGGRLEGAEWLDESSELLHTFDHRGRLVRTEGVEGVR